jgi:hypothetical protein
MDKKLSEVFSRWDKNGVVSKKDADFCDDMQKQLPDIIESLEKQRVKVFESMLQTILDDSVEDLAKKLKLKITKTKVKKTLKIVGFAALVLTATALALVTTIVTFGVAAGPILGVVGTVIGLTSSGAGLIAKAKGIWGSGRDESKNLEVRAGEYAQALAAFDAVLERQSSHVAARKAQLDLIEKQIGETKKLLATLDGYKKNVGDKVQVKIVAANKELIGLEKSQDELRAEYEQLSKAVDDAKKNRSPDEAKKLAATLKADRGVLDKISEHFGTLSGILGGISASI